MANFKALKKTWDVVEEESFALDVLNDNPAGICTDGTDFYIIDLTDDKVYIHNAAFVMTGNWALGGGNAHPWGIAWKDPFLYVTDLDDDKVYIYNVAGALQGNEDLDAGNSNCRGITWVAPYWYVVNFGSTVFKYDVDWVFIETFTLGSGNNHAYGICYNPPYFYISDPDDESFFQYNRDFNLLSEIDAGSSRSGLGCEYYNGYFYLTDPNVDKVFKYLDYSMVDITADIMSAKIEEELYRVSAGEILVKNANILAYHPGQEIEFYDKNDILSWMGIILSPASTVKGVDATEYVSKINLVGISSYFDAIYRKNYTTIRDSDYIIKDIIDNFLTKFHSYDDQIDDFTITYKYDLKKPILKMIYYLAMLERAVLHQLPDGEVFFNKYDNLMSIYEGYSFGSPDNFNNEVIGTQGLDIAWIDSLSAGDADRYEIIAEIGNHKNVLRIEHKGDGSTPRCTHDFPAAVITGDVESWIAASDITSANNFLRAKSSGTAKILIEIDGSKIYHYPNNVLTDTGVVPVNNIFNHIRITFDCSAGVNGEYQLYIDGNQIGANHEMTGLTTTLSNSDLLISQNLAKYMYLDAWGNASDDQYQEGDNLGFTILENTVSDNFAITKYVPAANRFITRAPVIGAWNSVGQVYVIGVAPTQVADEAQFGIRELPAWRDSEITNYTEAAQLAANLQAIFSMDTQFIYILLQGYGHIQVGYTMKIRSLNVFEITAKEFLCIGRVWHPTTDICEIILTDNILSEGNFNKRVVQKLYDIDAQQSFEDADVPEMVADGDVLPLVSLAQLRTLIGLTNAGHPGIGNLMINKTGAPSVKGTILEAHTDDFSCKIGDASGNHVIGIMYPDGVADGDPVLVIKGMAADVLLKDATASTAGNWCKTSDVAGRADMTGGSPPAAPTHFLEIGHCVETKAADVDVLAEIDFHLL